MKNLILFIILLLNVPLHLSYGMKDYPISTKSNKDTVTVAPKDWYNLDIKKNNFNGVSTERAYNELLKNKKSRKVVVAILDSGVDFYHEDLKDNIWKNTDEIPGNGIDDDQNGYIDDYNGWNFIGGKDGTHVNHDTYEVTRLYAMYKSKYEFIDTINLDLSARKGFEEYHKIKKEYLKLKERDEGMLRSATFMKERYDKAEKTILGYLGTESYSPEQLKDIKSEDDSLYEAAQLIMRLKRQNFSPEKIKDGIERIENRVNFCLNLEFDPRNIVGDNYEKPDDRYYGNNSLIGPDADHGTHVSGIVAANRNNNLGIKGIADDVELMILRVVPDGDERDKDVANAVFYAVDNGANIINMSFGKGYSPFKEYVDKAFEYAADHGVLIVHAAGNDSENNDIVANYPTRQYNSGKSCETWIEVGALSWKKGLFMAASFTNYGKKNVDLFAPGIDIYSTSPEQQYRKANGTSMSAPVVTGVAALVWSYYPQLTAKQLKSVILDSTVKYKKEKILLPGEFGKIVRFGDISVTGGVVNAYRALKLAEKIAAKKG